MSDKTIRHLVAGIATFVCLLVYAAGYIGGMNGWWWGAVSVGFIYYAMYHLIEA